MSVFRVYSAIKVLSAIGLMIGLSGLIVFGLISYHSTYMWACIGVMWLFILATWFLLLYKMWDILR